MLGKLLFLTWFQCTCPVKPAWLNQIIALSPVFPCIQSHVMLCEAGKARSFDRHIAKLQAVRYTACQQNGAAPLQIALSPYLTPTDPGTRSALVSTKEQLSQPAGLTPNGVCLQVASEHPLYFGLIVRSHADLSFLSARKFMKTVHITFLGPHLS